MSEPILIGLLALITASLGVIGGLGGAILLVPALVLAGTQPIDAAPLGMLMVAAGSLGASAAQLREGMLNHRIGVVGEVGASLGVAVGVLAAGLLSARFLTSLLAVVALIAAGAGGFRRGVRNLPDPGASRADLGENEREMAGAYPLGDGVVPYRARRVPVGITALGVVGVVAGMTGTSGGYLKTPIMSEVMHIPVKVAAATTTFMVGLTAASGLVAFAVQGRLDVVSGSAVVLGGLVGGRLGGIAQLRVSPVATRRVVSVFLAIVAVLLLVR